jgi:hypothetical protein
MPHSWIRPVSPTVLAERPLLDIGTGDGQTLAALAQGAGIRVGVDRSLPALRMAARSDPRDVLVARHGWRLATLPEKAVLGTSSLRRPLPPRA